MELSGSYSIAFKGLKNGVHDFEFEVGEAFFAAYPTSEIARGDCRVDVRMERAETQLGIDVRIAGYVVVPCDRCLEECRIPIDYAGRLLVKFSDEVHDEYDGEVLWLSPAENEVDLGQYIYESIVLSLPYQRVHPEGECDPEMMERFRIVSGEEFEEIEARAEAAGSDSLSAAELSKLSRLKASMEASEPQEEQ